MDIRIYRPCEEHRHQGQMWTPESIGHVKSIDIEARGSTKVAKVASLALKYDWPVYQPVAINVFRDSFECGCNSVIFAPVYCFLQAWTLWRLFSLNSTVWQLLYIWFFEQFCWCDLLEFGLHTAKKMCISSQRNGVWRTEWNVGPKVYTYCILSVWYANFHKQCMHDPVYPY